MTTGYNFIKSEWVVPPVSRLIFENRYTDELSRKILDMTKFEKIAYTTSGTESCDVSLSRYNKPIISFEGSYHGLTYLTNIVSNGSGIDFENSIIHLKFPQNIERTDETIKKNELILKEAAKHFNITGGTIIIELIQSDGGINVMPLAFTDFINQLKDRFHLHLIIDEVYTAYGRSGEMFLFQKYSFNPDMVCIGKGMAAGLPLGAILYNGNWGLPHNQVISMQSANMFVSKVAVEVLNNLKEERLEHVRCNGRKIIDMLSKIKNSLVSDIRGRGFMMGIEISGSKYKSAPENAIAIRNALMENGVICSITGSDNNVIKITPPVFIDDKTLYKGVNIIIETLSNYSN
jgi:4-aminobutyrate aminotransferase-like enzyme